MAAEFITLLRISIFRLTYDPIHAVCHSTMPVIFILFLDKLSGHVYWMIFYSEKH